MKQFAVLLFALFCASLTAAPTEFRLDISSQDNVIKPGAGEVKFSRAKWLAATEQPGYLIVSKAVGEDWTPIEFSFSAEKDGFVWLAFGASWEAQPEARPFIIIDEIKLNGQEAPNGGFEALKPDFSAPRIWNLSAKSKAALVDDAKAGKKAMKVNHDHRVGQGLKIEAGKTYTVALFAKIAK